jgi:sugar phosphate permease
MLIGIRVLFGFGEGIENGAQFKLIGAHFDSRERSSANALFLTALAVGPALGSPLVTFLIGRVGWRALFFWCGFVGLVVAVLLALLLPKTEGTEPGVTTESTVRPDWKGVLSRPTSWLTFCAYLFFNIGFWGFVYWMPSYLSATRHILLKDLGFTAAIPYIAGFFGMLVIGYLGTHILPRHRALLVGAGYLLAAGCLYAAFTAQELDPCIVALSGAAFFLYGGFGPFWAIAQGLIPDTMRGAFTGFVNFGGQIGGIIAPVVVGKIVDRSGSFTGGFVFMMAALFLAAGVLALLQEHRP